MKNKLIKVPTRVPKPKVRKPKMANPDTPAGVKARTPLNVPGVKLR